MGKAYVKKLSARIQQLETQQHQPAMPQSPAQAHNSWSAQAKHIFGVANATYSDLSVPPNGKMSKLQNQLQAANRRIASLTKTLASSGLTKSIWKDEDRIDELAKQLHDAKAQIRLLQKKQQPSTAAAHKP